jgi:hypothetical protein
VKTSLRQASRTKSTLNMAIAMEQRTWMQGLWEQSTTFEKPVEVKPIYAP